jgi:hypothetical protein
MGYPADKASLLAEEDRLKLNKEKEDSNNKNYF